MKLHDALRSLTEGPLWICRVKSNYKRLRCRMPQIFARPGGNKARRRRKTGA